MVIYSRLSQCDGKRPYARKQDAKRVARHVEQVTGRLTIYRCPHCGYWHLGNNRKPVKAS